jgi:DNA polymerase epsilon subunit 3
VFLNSLPEVQQQQQPLLTPAVRPPLPSPANQQVFISFITATANDVCKEKKRATINADDVFQALEDLEFAELLPALKESFEGGSAGAASTRTQPSLCSAQHSCCVRCHLHAVIIHCPCSAVYKKSSQEKKEKKAEVSRKRKSAAQEGDSAAAADGGAEAADEPADTTAASDKSGGDAAAAGQQAAAADVDMAEADEGQEDAGEEGADGDGEDDS